VVARLTAEGVVGNDVYRSGGHDELIDDWKVGDDYARELLEPFKGKAVRLTVEAIAPNEVDIDGVVDERRNIRYIGKATRQPDGKYVALAAVNESLCRVELTITPTVIGKDPEWEKGLGNG